MSHLKGGKGAPKYAYNGNPQVAYGLLVKTLLLHNVLQGGIISAHDV